jgi:iron complex transport system ATP-binding protein
MKLPWADVLIIACMEKIKSPHALAPLIEIVDATVFRGSTRVFHHFNLTLEQGSNTAILGPNGAGKSTLLKILTRELYPIFRAHSSIRILGDKRSDIWSLRSKLGLVSSDLQYEYAHTARGIEVVLSGFFASVGVWGHHDFMEDQIQRAKCIMEELEIISLADRKYGSLSTGQQRRLLLGRALVHNPPSLLLDEPTTGLDLTATFQYLNSMRRLMSDGRTLILVTHHIHEVPPEISRVVLLKDGEIFADGDKEDILTGDLLTALYEQPIQLVEKKNWYQAVPG